MEPMEEVPAVATTDILGRVSDVLTCKPSELAFACLPKLHIRRVGDHEADSARRAAELGDGTLEAREVEEGLAVRADRGDGDAATRLSEPKHHGRLPLRREARARTSRRRR